MAAPHPRSEPVSFTRRGGRLTERQQAAWDAVADHYVLEVPRQEADTSVDPEARLDVETAFGRTAPLVVEVGTGRGEALCAAALERPDVDFLGLEVYVPGVAQTLVTARHLGLENVRLAVVNAPEAFATWIAESSVEEVRTWFPDPWPKKRHHKRRLVTVPFTHLLARVLVPGGTWRLATDWADYADQVAEVIAASSALEGGRVERFAGRPVTRFEAKGVDAGREIHDFAATPVPVPTLGR